MRCRQLSCVRVRACVRAEKAHLPSGIDPTRGAHMLALGYALIKLPLASFIYFFLLLSPQTIQQEVLPASHVIITLITDKMSG